MNAPPWMVRRPRRLRLSDTAWSVLERIAAKEGADESVVADALLRAIARDAEDWVKVQLGADQLSLADWRSTRERA